MTKVTEHDLIILQRRAQRWRNAALVMMASIIIGFSWQPVYAWWQSISSSDEVHAAIPPERIHTVASQLLKNNITLPGRIRPLASVEISSPLSGTVSSMNVRYGDAVKKGQLLFHIQPDASFNSQLIQAKFAYKQALDEMNSLKSWSSSSEVRKARRQIFKQQQALKKFKRARNENRLLYQQEVIAQSQLEDSEQAVKNAQADLQELQETLQETLAKGSKHSIAMQQLKLDAAHNDLISLQHKYTKADVYATIDGVMMLAGGTKRDGSRQQPIKIGRHLGEGETMFQIANISKLRADLSVDDNTIIKLKTGLKATITSSVLPDMVLDAYTDSVSREPLGQSSRGGNKARYAVSLIIPTLTTAERDSVRMGMGVLVDVELSPPYQALMIPIDAVSMSNGKPHVSRLDAAGEAHEVTLTTGTTTLHDIEVLEGLKVGDRIVMPDI